MAHLNDCTSWLQTLNESVDRHYAQIDTATGTHGYRLRFTLFVADHQQVRHLFQRVLAYFIANLLVAQIGSLL